MEIDEDHDERVPCTLNPEKDQKHAEDSPAVSHDKTSERTVPAPQTNNTTKASTSTEARYNLRANPTPKRYSDFLMHRFSDVRAALKPLSTRGEGT